MRNLFLMSVFGLFMISATSGQSVTSISLVSPAYANDDNENTSTTTSSNDAADDSTTTSSNDAADDSTTTSSNDAADDSTTISSSDDDVAFHCPNGITICYKADGTEFTDVNNLPASAAGSGGSGGSGGGSYSVKPVHFRTF